MATEILSGVTTNARMGLYQDGEGYYIEGAGEAVAKWRGDLSCDTEGVCRWRVTAEQASTLIEGLKNRDPQDVASTLWLAVGAIKGNLPCAEFKEA